MTEEAIFGVLKEIYSRVPKAWRENAVKEVPLTPTMAMVVDKALTTRGLSPEKKEELRVLQESGYFDKKKYIEDPLIVKKIDNFVNREVKKAVKEGRLPNKNRLAELKLLWEEQKKTL